MKERKQIKHQYPHNTDTSHGRHFPLHPVKLFEFLINDSLRIEIGAGTVCISG